MQEYNVIINRISAVRDCIKITEIQSILLVSLAYFGWIIHLF